MSSRKPVLITLLLAIAVGCSRTSSNQGRDQIEITSPVSGDSAVTSGGANKSAMGAELTAAHDSVKAQVAQAAQGMLSLRQLPKQ